MIRSGWGALSFLAVTSSAPAAGLQLSSATTAGLGLTRTRLYLPANMFSNGSKHLARPATLFSNSSALQFGGNAVTVFLVLASLAFWHNLLESWGGAAASAGGDSIDGPSCQPLSTAQRRQLGGRHLPQGCLHLRDVCADQQQLVMMSPHFRPDAQHPRPLPTFQPEAKFNFPFQNESNPDAWVGLPSVGATCLCSLRLLP